MRSETILVHYVHDYVYYGQSGKNKGKHLLHFAGVSDKPSKLMKFQVWEMPFASLKEARESLDQYLEKIKKGTFIIIIMPKKKD